MTTPIDVLSRYHRLVLEIRKGPPPALRALVDPRYLQGPSEAAVQAVETYLRIVLEKAGPITNPAVADMLLDDAIRLLAGFDAVVEYARTGVQTAVA